MNTNLTELAFILDASGSMGSLRNSAIDGYNGFVEAQRALPGEARLSLVLFNSVRRVVLAGWPLDQVEPLSVEDYQPHSNTALYDAIGQTVDEIGLRLANTAEAERPGKVIVAILTDGLENASRHYSLSQIKAMIQHQREVYAWEFLFLGANQDAVLNADRLGIDRANAATFAANERDIMASYSAVSRKSVAMRMMGMSMASAAMRKDLASTTEALLQEERDKADPQ